MSLKPEQIAQINIINWFTHQFPELEPDLHHFANERKCTLMEGRLLKRMGVKKGVADFFLAFPQNQYAGLWVELKVNGGKLSPEQKSFLARKHQRGYCAMPVWEEEAAKELILTYLRNYIPMREYLNLNNSV